MQELGAQASADWLHGLKIVAVAVVAFALWGMGRTLAPDRTRITMAVVAAAVILLWGGIAAQLLVIGGGALLGLIILRPPEQRAGWRRRRVSGGTRAALALLIAFVALLALLPVASRVTDSLPLDVFDSFYRSGSLVFGGGHVVLPLIEAEVVPPGWVTGDEFLAGYGAAQAVPGPLFTFAAFLGASVEGLTPRWGGGLLALAAIFAPSFLLVPGRAAVLGARAWHCAGAAGADGRERGGGGTAARGAVRSAVDQRHRQAGGFRGCGCRVCSVGVLESAAVVGGCADRYRGRGGGAAALGRHAIPQRPQCVSLLE